ncbi:Sulfur carrier protein FdhD [Tenacibaculum sp. 190524A02b]|uniref:formate dehydrogenase accessory sulfurtransferase FdhD n=1 Tax=Tenacibaculum vairaonense TaxID=3137860 RepID=UPI0032B2ABA2
MKQTNIYESIKVTTEKNTFQDDSLVIEAPLQININNQPYTIVMRTPGNDIELINGLLYAEDIYRNNISLKVELEKTDESFNDIYNVEIPKNYLGNGYLNKRTLLSVSSCGICGKKELNDITVSGDAINNKTSLLHTDIQKMFTIMTNHQYTFMKTGGSHACAIFDKNNKFLTCKEDIGRHNAVDKCVGSLRINQQLKEAFSMFVSGRVSYEIVSKAFFAKIPIIIAVSACSSLAVDFAKEFGICLIGFSRKDKMTIYANPQYIQYEY